MLSRWVPKPRSTLRTTLLLAADTAHHAAAGPFSWAAARAADTAAGATGLKFLVETHQLVRRRRLIPEEQDDELVAFRFVVLVGCRLGGRAAFAIRRGWPPGPGRPAAT